MRKTIIDTNCLISFVSDRNPGQQEVMASIFNQARQLNLQIVCHHHVISEFVYVLTSVYSLQPEKVQKMIKDLVSMPGCIYDSEVDVQTILSLWPSKIPDYGDAVIAAYCKQEKGARVATFDNKFKKALTRIGLSVYSF